MLFVGADVLILCLLDVRKRQPAAGRRRERRRVIDAADRERLPRGAARRRLGRRSLVGLAAFWVALPPLKVRAPVVPIVIGLVALDVGIGPLIRGVKRIGWARGRRSACSASCSATSRRARASTHLDQVVVWSALIAAMLRYATPLAFAALGGIFSERSGVVNIGLEGMMLTGAFFGILGADKLELLGARAPRARRSPAAALALVHAFFSIHLRADQIVGGTAINFLALGITGYLFIDIYGGEGTPPDIPRSRTST